MATLISARNKAKLRTGLLVPSRPGPPERLVEALSQNEISLTDRKVGRSHSQGTLNRVMPGLWS